jgi:hypothetical protein
MNMKPMLLFVYLVILSGLNFYFAFADQAAQVKYFPIKSGSLRRKLGVGAGSVLLLCALLALYAAISKTR